MIYTLADIRAVARSKDERLSDVDAYPDTWIDTQIEHAFEVAEDAKQVFYTKEKYDLSQNIIDGLSQVEIILQKEPHAIYAITVDNSIKTEITGNNHIIVTIPTSASTLADKTLTVRYFFYPTLPFISIEMASEVYHLFRHALYVNLYGSLRDKENEVYHQGQVDRFIKEGTFQLPPDFEETTSKFERNTWL